MMNSRPKILISFISISILLLCLFYIKSKISNKRVSMFSIRLSENEYVEYQVQSYAQSTFSNDVSYKDYLIYYYKDQEYEYFISSSLSAPEGVELKRADNTPGIWLSKTGVPVACSLNMKSLDFINSYRYLVHGIVSTKQQENNERPSQDNTGSKSPIPYPKWVNDSYNTLVSLPEDAI